jgi:hypothetical protein
LVLVLRILSGILLKLCFIGMAIALAVHVSAMFAPGAVADSVVFPMHLGLMALAIPTILVSNKVTAGVRPKDLWPAVRAATPKWLQLFVKVFGVYCLIGFVVFVATTEHEKSTDGMMQPRTLAYFSAGWALGYAALAQYLFLVRNRLAIERRCPQGHEVGASAQYCELCGTPLR